MKKKSLLLLISLCALVSCNKGNNNSSSINDSQFSESESNTTSDSEESSETISESGSSQDSSYIDEDSSSEEKTYYTSVESVKEFGKSIKDDYSSIETNNYAKLEGKVIFTLDQISTSKEYKQYNRYRALFFDETGYILLALDDASYQKVKNYQYQNTTYYSIEGAIVKIDNNIIVNVKEFTFIKNHEDNINVDDYFQTTSPSTNLKEIYDRAKNLPLNYKGMGFEDLALIKLRYIEEINDSVLLMYDGANFIKLSGNNKISNNFTKGETYDVLGLVNVYKYAFSLKLVSKKISSSKINDIDYTKYNTLQGNELYKIDYTNDKKQHFIDYENVYNEIYKFEGYVNGYSKNGSDYMVVCDTYKENAFTSYTTAATANALFIDNNSEYNLKTSNDFINSKLYNYCLEDVKISFYYYPTLKNSQHYWSVYIVSDIQVL